MCKTEGHKYGFLLLYYYIEMLFVVLSHIQVIIYLGLEDNLASVWLEEDVKRKKNRIEWRDLYL